MQLIVTQRGANSKALIIPSQICKAMGIEIGDVLDIEIKDIIKGK